MSINPLIARPRPEDPFFNLLEGAEAIQINEISPTNARSLASSLEKALLAENPPRYRSFLVQIRPAPAEAEAVGDLSQPLENYPLPYLESCAQVLLESKDFLLARNIYSFLLKKNIRDPKALMGLGVCLLRLGETVSSKKCFKAVYELYQDDAALVWLGQSFSAEGNDLMAMDHFYRVKDAQSLPTAERYHYHRELGNCLTRRGGYDEAHQCYEQALTVSPNSCAIFINLGTLEIQRDQIAEAKSYFERALSVNDKHPKALCGLGIVAMAENDMQGAQSFFYQALDIDSQSIVAIMNLVVTAHHTERFASAKIRLNHFLENEPNQLDVRFALASLLYKQSDWRGCEQQIDRILKEDSVHAKALSLKEELLHNRFQA